MAIPFLSDIEHLITEHGSATVLRERLAFAVDQFSALEKQIVNLSLQVSNLTLEKEHLQLESKQQKAEIQRLSEQINQKAAKRPETQERLLLLVAENESRDTEWFAKILNVSTKVAEFHLWELYSCGFLHWSRSSSSLTRW